MKSDIIRISNTEQGMEQPLVQVEKVAAYKALSEKSTMYLRLLTEEMMALVRSITGKAEGEYWIEDSDGVYQLHLRVNTLLDSSKRDKLIDASTSKKNEAARGLMGKIRAFFEYTDGDPFFDDGFMMRAESQMYGAMVWSLEDYREQLIQYREQNRQGAQEAWDELEKSVVSHVADEIKVSIKGRVVEMIIFKKLD